MGGSNPSRFLIDGSDDYGLSRLKAFNDGLVEAFRDTSVLYGGTGPKVIAEKNIMSGRSHQFLMLADTPEAEIHTPGDELLGQAFAIEDGTITCDDILAAHHDIPEDQEALSDVSMINALGKKAGGRLARQYDQRAFYVGLNAARTSGVTKAGLSVHNGGNRVTRVNASGVTTAYAVSATGAQNFRADVAQLAQLMDEDYVPESGRYLFITPYIRRVLGQDTTIFDSRYNAVRDNDINERRIGKIEGFEVIVAKGRMPTTNVTSYTGVHTKYNGDFRNAGTFGEPVALALCGASDASAAIGAVRRWGITPTVENDNRRGTVFVKAKMLAGLGVLHPWCAGEIAVPAA